MADAPSLFARLKRGLFMTHTELIARVGDVVTVTGTIAVDKTLGAGYAYAVMLQGATIAVK